MKVLQHRGKLARRSPLTITCFPESDYKSARLVYVGLGPRLVDGNAGGVKPLRHLDLTNRVVPMGSWSNPRENSLASKPKDRA